MKKIWGLLLIVLLVLVAIFGYDRVSSAVANTAQTVKKQMEEKIQEALEPYKVEVVEMKTAAGNLNGGNFLTVQFFGAILIRTQQESYADTCAKALEKVFQETGYTVQTEQTITHEYLKNRELSYDFSDFSDGTYYTVYVYSSGFSLDFKKEN